MNNNFWYKKEEKSIKLDPLMTRNVLAHSKNLMMVELTMKKGGVGKLHHHVHEQMTYVLKGVFEFEVNGIKKIVRSGDALYMEPDVPHSMLCIEDGVLLDIFTPQREDLL